MRRACVLLAVFLRKEGACARIVSIRLDRKYVPVAIFSGAKGIGCAFAVVAVLARLFGAVEIE